VAVSGRYAYVACYGANTLQVFDLGGAYIQQLEAGALETGTLQTRDTVTVGNGLNVHGGLTVGASARVDGVLFLEEEGTNTQIAASSGACLTAGGQWQNASDRALKDEFTAIEPEAVLAKVTTLPITEWRYKAEAAGVKHLGPVAQDFYHAFGLGDSDKGIGTVDESGVALAAIQGLSQKMETENAALRSENAELNQRLQEKDAEMAELKRDVAELKALAAPPAK
jgi:hypothetical protein